MSITGAGYLTALDALCDVSYQLFEPLADTVITSLAPTGYGDGGFGDPGYGDGIGTVIGVGNIAALYVGAQVIVGYGLPTAEVTTVLQVDDTDFIAGLVNSHAPGEKVFGATFPVQQPTDPLWTQSEMLAYLSTAANDFLTEVPLVYAINSNVIVLPTRQNAALPDDCIEPMRVAFQMPQGPYPLRESSQANLDTYDYRWSQAEASSPLAYFRDKIPSGQFGIWPRVNNTAVFEIVYSQEQTESMQWMDGFLFPDLFVPLVKYRVLSFAYSKDGEARNPGLAKYFSARYDFGVKVAKMFLDASMDANLEMAG